MTNQISKIQLRRGMQQDLLLLSNGLDVAEIAFTTDTNRVFIGSDPSTANVVQSIHNSQNVNGFPETNVEILTEFSPTNQFIFDMEARNISTAFIISSPMAIAPNAWTTLMIQQQIGVMGNAVQIPFVINAQSNTGQFGTAHITYHIIDVSTGSPLRTGRLVLFYQGNAFPPSIVDEAISNPNAGYPTNGLPLDPNIRYGMIAFQAIQLMTGVGIQYQINMTGMNLPTPTMYFRVEQPSSLIPI